MTTALLQLLAIAGVSATCAIAPDCDMRVTDVVSARGATTRLAGIVDVMWPAGLPEGTRVQLEATCAPDTIGVFDETTAIFGKLARSPHAIRIAISARPTRFEVRLAVPAAAGGRPPRVFAKTLEGGPDERHEAFGPVDGVVIRNNQLVFTVEAQDLAESNIRGYSHEAVFVIAWN